MRSKSADGRRDIGENTFAGRQFSSWLIVPKPNLCQAASEHSTMKVAVSASNW